MVIRVEEEWSGEERILRDEERSGVVFILTSVCNKLTTVHQENNGRQ